MRHGLAASHDRLGRPAKPRPGWRSGCRFRGLTVVGPAKAGAARAGGRTNDHPDLRVLVPSQGRRVNRRLEDEQQPKADEAAADSPSTARYTRRVLRRRAPAIVRGADDRLSAETASPTGRGEPDHRGRLFKHSIAEPEQLRAGGADPPEFRSRQVELRRG